LGAACARAAAASVSLPSAAAAGSASGRAQAPAALGCGPGAALHAAAEHLGAIASAGAAVAAAAAVPGYGGSNHDCQPTSCTGPTAAACSTNGPMLQMAMVAATAKPSCASSLTDPWVTLASATAVAGGLMEGCLAAVRLQPIHLREPLLATLQPTLQSLTATLEGVAAAAGSAATPHATTRTDACAGSVAWALYEVDPKGLLCQAVGYVWARLQAQPALPELPPPAAGLVQHMVTSATARSEGRWHPAGGVVSVLLAGSLGIARLLHVAGSAGGGPSDAAMELLEQHMQGPLFADTQLLARTALEAARQPAAPQAAAMPRAPPSALASRLLHSLAAETRRLHWLYGGVADDVGGRTWLAALPPAASGALRDILDRTFVCVVSVLTAAYDTLAAPLAIARHREAFCGPAAGTGSARRCCLAAPPMVPTVVAFGCLADVQFCALQLRVHGDLVARLSSDMAAFPAEALAPLLGLLPCYGPFAATYETGAPVAVSRLAFILPVAASCVPHVDDVGGAAASVLPYIYLLLKGAPEAVTQAAHAVWAALLAGVCEAGDGMPSQAQGAHGGVETSRAELSPVRPVDIDLAASMVPFYVARTCQPPCSVADVELMERGLRQVWRSLPLAHSAKVWSIAHLAQELRMRVHVPNQRPATLSNGAGHRQHEESQDTDVAIAVALPVAERFATALGVLIAEIDFPLLKDALRQVDGLLRVVEGTGRIVIVQTLLDSWLLCNDYARKPLLDEWLRTKLATA
ncbi:hypothetical protein Agub_g13015, partial [Astrephomene gubernaculifera]